MADFENVNVLWVYQNRIIKSDRDFMSHFLFYATNTYPRVSPISVRENASSNQDISIQCKSWLQLVTVFTKRD